MDLGRRTGITLSKRRRTRVIKSSRKGLPNVDPKISARPVSRRVESRNPLLSITSKSQLRPKTKKAAQSRRPPSKSRHLKRGIHGPTDPMVSTSLSSLDLHELRELERIFLDNQSYLRRVFQPPADAAKQTPPSSRRSGVSVTVSRSAALLASKSAARPHSKSGTRLQIQSRGTQNENSFKVAGKSKEQVAAESIAESVKYVAREWIGMNVMRDLIPAKNEIPDENEPKEKTRLYSGSSKSS